MSLATHCIPWDETCSLCNPPKHQNPDGDDDMDVRTVIGKLNYWPFGPLGAPHVENERTQNSNQADQE